MYSKSIMCTAVASAIAIGMMPQCAQAITNDEILQGIGYDGQNGYVKYAKDSKGVTWFYSFYDEDKTASIYGTNDITATIEIPAEINGYKVTNIEGVAVQYGSYDKDRTNPNASKIKKIVIPSSVTFIESYALQGCTNLQDIDMPAQLLDSGAASKSMFIVCPNTKVNGSYHPEFANLKNDLGYKLGFNDITNYEGKHRVFVVDASNFKKGWLDHNGKRYYFYTQSGYMATGFIQLGNVHYYLDEAQNNLGNLVTGWKKINGSWYYFSPTAAKNREKGYMVTGWLGNYYLYGSGKMATGFINLNGSYYYLDPSSGARQVGWKKINGYWYYFAKSGEAKYTGLMTKGWKKIGGAWYYFYGSGKMACNTTIGGYRLGSSGAWVK